VAADRDVRVVGVQPEGAAHAKSSLDAGEIRPLDDVDTVAEGIADTRMLETTFAIASEVVDEVVTVSDREIAAAVTLLAERAKLVAEGAGAAPLAAALSDRLDLTGADPAVVVSGGNVNLTDHADLARNGLFELGRYAEARLALANWPAAVESVIDRVTAEGAELDALERATRTAADRPNRTPVTVGIEGRGADHLEDVLNAVDELDGVSVVERSVADEK
jgi:threonine dehydratase